MAELSIRRLRVDFSTPFARHWCDGDAFRTAFFDALSMSFPAGEQFFIDSVKRGVALLSEADKAAFAEEVRGFIGQEATHRHLHAQFNAQRKTFGLINHWEPRILRRRRSIEDKAPVYWLAATAASEHFTAILAEYLLSRPHLFDQTEEHLRDFWFWHASEESEHRCTAYKVYQASQGGEWLRRYIYVAVTVHFLTDAFRQTINNLWHDGTLFKLSTWTSGLRFALGRDGIVVRSFAAWLRYFRADFDPAETDGAPGAQWLHEHADVAVPIASTLK